MKQDKITALKQILDESRYTVALCGSGMMEEGGFIGVKNQNRAYEIESKYGISPEEIFSSAYYTARPELFFNFYKNEMLTEAPEMTASGPVLAAMERKGKLKCVITSNIYDLPRRAGCTRVINLHGDIYHNRCPRCGKEYPLEYVKYAKGVPLCENCGAVVRPMISLFGEMIDNFIITSVTEEIEKADVLLLLGTNLTSDVYRSYIRYFEGSRIVVIHQHPHHSDIKADFVIIDEPKHILPQLGY